MAVDVNHAIDYPGVSKTLHGQIDIGKGPTVSRGANTNHVTFDLIKAAAKADDIPFQGERDGRRHRDGRQRDAVEPGWHGDGAARGSASLHAHPVELLSLKDLEDCARLMAGYCRQVKPDTDFTPR